MIGLAIVIAVIAAALFALLRYHPTMRYPAYVVDYGGRRYMMRPRGINVWTRRERKRYLAQMNLYAQMDRDRRIYSMLVEERVAQSIIKPETAFKIAGI